MTPENNALLARLDGWTWYEYTKNWQRSHTDSTVDHRAYPPDYDDERNLMPLFFENDLAICPDARNRGEGIGYVFGWECTTENEGIITFDEDPKIAIQQALLAIAREKFSE